MRSFRSLLFPALFLAAAGLQAQSTVPTLTRSIPAQTFSLGTSVSIDLREIFSLPGVTGQIVQFDTVLGVLNVELRADAAPQNAANFLSYVQSGAYTNSFIHRSASLDSAAAVSIVQGGGFAGPISGTGVADVPTPDPLPIVPLEYNLPNERGSLAAARGTDINSATSQWYFNVRDNSTILNQSNNGGYTVFGRVIGTGMTVIDAIAALPRFNAGSPFDNVPLRDFTGGSVTDANLMTINSTKAIPVYPDAAGLGALIFSAQTSGPAVVNAILAGSTLTLAGSGLGSAAVTVRATDVNGNTAETTFAVTVDATLPSFSRHPVPQTIAVGSTVALSAAARNVATYRWQRNGIDVPGATTATLVITGATAANAGNYTVIATNGAGATTSSTATVAVINAAAADVGRLINLAIRTNAGTGAQTLIVGFAVGGREVSGSKPLLLRGVGPGLAQFGVGGVLVDPVATMYRGDTIVATNDNWGGTAAITDRAKQVGAFEIPAASLDAALAVSQVSDSYSVQVTGKNNGVGIALAEIYDATAPGTFATTTPRLVNVSARAQVGTGGDILIAGFVIGGGTAKTVLIRAIGPGLAAFGVPGTLVDPKLQLISGETLVIENDNWGGDALLTTVGSSVGAFALGNAASKDAMLLITLPPGNYGAQVSGANGGTGIALVEVYEVP